MNPSPRPFVLVAALVATLAGCTNLDFFRSTKDANHSTQMTQTRISAVKNTAFEVATSAFEARDFRKAYDLWLPLAESGMSTAQTAIAYLYATGQGVVQSDTEALSWFTKAAQQGDPDAQNNLGYMYAKGRGTKPSREQAIKWYLEAAQRGHRTAQQNLFALNNDGLERKVTAPATAEMVRIKAQKGEPLYQFLFGMSYLVGNGSQEIDESAALKWIQKAADQGFSAAEYQLGQFYLHGRGFAPDQDRAYYWISRAADKKYIPAITWMHTVKAQRASFPPPLPTPVRQ